MRRRTVNYSFLVLFAAALLSMLALAGLRSASAQATTTKFNEHIPFDFVLEFPVDCPGIEPVHVVGTFHRVTTVTTDNRDGWLQSGGYHYRSTDNFSMEGIGLVTGNRYRFVGAGHQTMQQLSTNDNPGADVNTVADTVSLVSQGGDDNLLIHLVIHTTINANGEPTSTIEHAFIKCNGQE